MPATAPTKKRNRAPYSPRPGSIAERAWQHLLHSPGYRARAPELAAVADCETAYLHGSLQACVTNGFFTKETVDRNSYYTLGPAALGLDVAADADAVAAPAAAPAADADDDTDGTPTDPSDGQPTRRIVPASQAEPIALGTRAVASVFGWAAASAHKAALPELAGDAGAAHAGPTGFRCGLYSDGTLVIEDGAERMVLPRHKTDALFEYLDRMAVETAA